MQKAFSSILPQINRFFEKHVNLKPEERKLVLLLQINIFLLISVLLILKPLFTSMLLRYHGVDILPIAFILIAMVAVVLHIFRFRVAPTRPLISSIYLNHSIHIIILLLIAAMISMDYVGAFTSLLLYIYVSFFALITASYFYQYCQSLLTIREAKRILPFVGSAAIAGGVFGGYFTSIVVPHIGRTGLILSSVLFICSSLAIMRHIHAHYASKVDDDTEGRDEDDNRIRSNISIIFNKHVRNIIFIIGLGVFVSKLVDYQFNYVVSANISSEEEMTQFFGFWFSTINVVGLLAQVFLVNRVINRVGVTISMAIMPLLILAASILLLMFPVLSFAIFIKLVEGSMKQSIYKTSTEINIMPLHNAVRNKAKTLVDVVIDSLATGAAGVLIFFVINRGNLPFYAVGCLTAFSTATWLYFIYHSKSSYLSELSNMVLGNDRTLSTQDSIQEESKKYYLEDLMHSDPRFSQNPKEYLLNCMAEEEAWLRVSAMVKYFELYPQLAHVELEHLIQDENIKIRKTYFFLLMQSTNSAQAIDELYISQDNVNKVILTSALAEAIENSYRLRERYNLFQKIDASLAFVTLEYKGDNSVKLLGHVYMAIAISRYTQKYNLIRKAIAYPVDKTTQAQALRAVGYGGAKRLVNDIHIETIYPDNHKLMYRVLAEFPTRTLQRLKIMSSTSDKNLRLYLPVCEYIGNQRSVDFLFSCLDSKKLGIRRKALIVINGCRKKYPKLNFQKGKNTKRLRRVLRHMKHMSALNCLIMESQSQLDVNDEILKKARRRVKLHLNKSLLDVFIYLTLISGKDDIALIYKTLRSDQRDAALDLLDGLLTYEHRVETIPLLEMVIKRNFQRDNLLHIDTDIFNSSKMRRSLKDIKDDLLIEVYKSLSKTAHTY